jgi:TRAP-type C4-dicarboxylate transport system permease small subunit
MPNPGLVRRIDRYIEKGLSTLLIVLMAVMVLDVTWQVVSRFLLRDPSSFTEELAGYLLIWVGLLGAAYALKTRAHLGIDLLANRLPGPSRKAIEITAHLLAILFALFVMLIGGARLVRLAFQLDQISAAMGIKVGYVYLAVPLSGTLMIVFSLTAILEVIRGEAASGEARTVDGGL